MKTSPLTLARIRSFTAEKGQAFLRDSLVPGLSVRASPGGKKAYVFERRLGGKTVRLTIGSVDHWLLENPRNPEQPGARERAREFATMIDRGIDPRESLRAKVLKHTADLAVARDAWDEYIAERRVSPKWGERHLEDHLSIGQKGGDAYKRWGGRVTQPGVLAPLLNGPLHAITAEAIKAFLRREVPVRATRTRHALVLLNKFLKWCAVQQKYRAAVHLDACTRMDVKDLLPPLRTRDDCLKRTHLPAFFREVRALPNPVHSVYLQVNLLIGSRSGEELKALRWEDVDFAQYMLTLRGRKSPRTIALSPYVSTLLGTLPRVRGSQWVFPADSKSGHIEAPNIALDAVCHAARIPDLTLHGLRRSLPSLCEDRVAPGGVMRQIQGHIPSANDAHERAYVRRELEMLMEWQTRIENWFLEQAGIEFVTRRPDGSEVVRFYDVRMHLVVDNTSTNKAARRAALRAAGGKGG